MNKVLFLLSAMFFVAMVSCHKQPDTDSNKITFGDTTGMIVITYDSSMWYNDTGRPFILDLNNDGVNDIKIETYYDGPHQEPHQTLTIICLNNNIELFGDSIVKEYYYHHDTVISTYIDASQTKWEVTTDEHLLSTCEKPSEDDPIQTTTAFDVFACDGNESITMNDHFQSGKAILFREDTYGYLAYPDPTTNTAFVYTSSQIYQCWNFPTSEEKYIGFKLTQNGNSRLGWIKIFLDPHATLPHNPSSPDYATVVNTKLIETAIQE